VPIILEKSAPGFNMWYIDELEEYMKTPRLILKVKIN